MSQNLDDLAIYYHERLPHETREYLRGRGLSDEVIDAQQLGWGGWRITIPIRNRSGEVAFFKLARAPQDQSNSAKMLTTPGSSVELYGWENVHPGTERLIICEGEFDRLVLESRGFAAVTSTGGALTFLRNWAEALRSVSSLYVCFDRDAAGNAGTARVGSVLPNCRVIQLPSDVGQGGDVSDFLVRLGRTPEDFETLLSEAKPFAEYMRDNAMNAPKPAVSRSEIDAIKAGVRLESVVARYVELQPRGRALVGRCPFHEDREPSLTVYPDTQTFHCFGCRAHGDVVSFLMRAGRLTFKEAIDSLRRFAA